MKILYRLVLLLILLFFTSIGTYGDEMKKHPGWAIVATALVPGGGQFYAENYARGIFYSTLQISLVSMTIYEKIQERDYWEIYKQDNKKDTWDKFNKHKSRVRNLLWWDAGIWFLSCADAFTDAHFYGFNEKVDISIEMKDYNGAQVGLVYKF
jgi:hypothetical protein